LVPYFPESLLEQMLKAALKLQDEKSRALVLIALVPRLPDVLPEALKVTQKVRNLDDRSILLTSLASDLSATLLVEALERALQNEDSYHQISDLCTLAPYLPESLALKLFKFIEKIKNDEHSYAYILAILARCLPNALLKAMDILRETESDNIRRVILTNLAPYLPEEFQQEAIEVAKIIQDKLLRAKTLTVLGSYQLQALPAALETARAIQYPPHRTYALSLLVPYFPTVLDETLSAACEPEIQAMDSSFLIAALTEFAPYLSESTFLEALKITRTLRYEGDRVQALLQLATVLTQLPTSKSCSLWLNLMHDLSLYSRSELLRCLAVLAPVIFTLSKQEGVTEVFRTVQSVGRWWS
jgi:hypothetical protein